MTANDRIQWLHKMILEKCYPNATHVADKFSISNRQAQRDVDRLRHELSAPLAYSATHRGYYYTEPYAIPVLLETENDADFHDVLRGMRAFDSDNAKRSVLQLQLPYSATLEIHDKMTVLNLRSFIVEDLPHHNYRCDFPSVELFLGVIFATGSDIKIIKPDWLKKQLVEFAARVLRNNSLDSDKVEK